MLAKKEPTTISPGKEQQKKLDHLYARRDAIDGLIQSLEDYHRCREKCVSIQGKRRSA
jgi:hypothetical protein